MYFNNGSNTGDGFRFEPDMLPLVDDAPAENAPVEDNTKSVRLIFSRAFLALFIYIAVSQIVMTVIEIASAIILGPEGYAAISQNYTVAIIKSSICQYIFGFGAFLLFIFKVPTFKPMSPAIRMKPAGVLSMFTVCFGISYIGSIIGQVLSNAVGAVTGQVPDNTVNLIISSIPMWLLILVVVVIGPIFEELVFRKFLMDRLLCIGEYGAVLISSLAFGLFHQNLYQLFYAAMIGVVLGFVYVKTRNILYPIIIHVCFNFFGSALPMLLDDYIYGYYDMLQILQSGGQVDQALMAKYESVVMIYGTLIGAICIFGFAILIKKLKSGEFRLSRECELYVPKSRIIDTCIVNGGVIAFTLFTVTFTILSLF